MRHLIIGNGVAGTTAATNIRMSDANAEITLLTHEPYPFYSRIRLIDFLSRSLDPEKLILKKQQWHDDNGIRLAVESMIDSIDIEKKEAVSESGERYPYDKLLIATGGKPFMPPLPGADGENVFALRSLNDAKRINGYASTNKKAVIIGGGVLGLEAGYNLIKAGNEVEVLEYFGRLLPRQMDVEGGKILQKQLESLGFSFRLGAKSKSIDESGVELDDGSAVDGDMFIISAGVRPEVMLAEKLGIKAEKGIPVNDRMETEIPDIYAAGDAALHRDVYYGIWPAAEKQGETAGKNMAGGSAAYGGTVISNSLKVAGVKLFSAGDIDADGKFESIVEKNPDKFLYKKLVINEGRIIGAILYGDVSPRAKIMKAIEEKTDIAPIRKELETWNIASL